MLDRFAVHGCLGGGETTIVLALGDDVEPGEPTPDPMVDGLGRSSGASVLVTLAPDDAILDAPSRDT